MRKLLFAGAMMLAACLGVAEQAEASVIVVTPTANTNSPGTNNVNAPFGAAGGSDMYVLQVQYAASLFSGVAIGSQLTSIGFRLASGATTNSRALVYDDFSIQVGSGAHALGSLSRTFSSNLGSDTILARSGALTFAKNALPADACTRQTCRPKVLTNSFFTIDLTTPYTYTGGDLLMTFSSKLAAATIGMVVPLDAVDPYQVATVNTVSQQGTGSVSPNGTPVNFSYAPILRFAFDAPVAVPEPESLSVMVGGIGLLAAAMRRRRAKLSLV